MLTAADIARRLGLRRYSRSWRGRCPACDYPSTFSVRACRDGRTMLFCSSCQDRDALADAVLRATGQQHQSEVRDDLETAARQRKQDAALRLLAWIGIRHRHASRCLSHTPRSGWFGRIARAPVPCRLSAPGEREASGPDRAGLRHGGTPLAVHRTFLTRDGRKATVEPAKASLGPVWGGAIHLSELIGGTCTPLVVGEGIETAASAGHLMGLPAWAAISAGNMAKGLVLPPEARRVVIAADPDKSGRVAARAAWLRWHAEGRAVQIATPDGAGDFNDLLCAREAGSV